MGEGVRNVLKKRSGGKDGKSGKMPKGFKLIPKEGELVVRFLTGTDQWLSYREGWVQEGKSAYPVVVDEDLVEEWEEEHGRWPSTRFLASAIDVDNNAPVVVQLTLGLAQEFVEKEDKLATKNKDITDYDYELYKRGDGTDTKYFSEVVPTSGTLDLSRYEDIALDPNDILEQLKGRGAPESEDEPDIDDDDTVVEEAKPVAKKKFTFPKKK